MTEGLFYNSDHVSVLVLEDEDALSHGVDPRATGPPHHLLVLTPLQEVCGHVWGAQDDSESRTSG